MSPKEPAWCERLPVDVTVLGKRHGGPGRGRGGGAPVCGECQANDSVHCVATFQWAGSRRVKALGEGL